MSGGEGRAKELAGLGVQVIEVAADGTGEVDMGAALAALAERGLTRVLVEGGGALAAALLRSRLVDRVAWFRAPMLIGGDGVAMAAALGVEALDQAPRLRRLIVAQVGDDVLETYAVEA